MSAVLILTFGIGMGMLAALRPGRVDDWVLVSTSIAVSTPSFVVAVGLISLFAVQLGWFPVFGAGMGVESRIHHLFLPAVALALALTSYLARTTRAAVREQLSRDHVEAATSRGLPYRLVVRKHVMRNAMIPITTVAGLTVAGLIASTAIVETAFGLNGLGGLLIQSVIAKDFPVVQAVCLILVLAFLITNTVVDILYAVLDPRVALGRRQT
jgi:peptide/nickel transport system permease protein